MFNIPQKENKLDIEDTQVNEAVEWAWIQMEGLPHPISNELKQQKTPVQVDWNPERQGQITWNYKEMVRNFIQVITSDFQAIVAFLGPLENLPMSNTSN